MPLFSSELKYAETHFKFKLPWSFLYKKWPEIFADAPRIVLPGKKLPLWLVAKDSHLFNVTVLRVDYLLEKDNVILDQGSWELNQFLDKPFHFEELPFDEVLPAGEYKLRLNFDVENTKGKRQIFADTNLPKLQGIPIEFKVLRDPYPYPNQWLAGEHHCHTTYTSDPVEFGAPIEVLQKSAEVLGLDYVNLTDHSYNFAYDSVEYMTPRPPAEKWNEFLKETKAAKPKPYMIPGIEVSCGNQHGENVHLLLHNCEKYTLGLGDSGRRWFNNKPDQTIQECLDQNPNSPAFAAHPCVKIGKLEKKIFRRGSWSKQDISQDLNGLQFWNGSRNKGFDDGKKFWVEQLLAGKKLLPIAGNDAHGDLNRTFGVQIPLVKLKWSRNHCFGVARTLFPTVDGSLNQLVASMKSNKCVCTDGPFLDLTLSSNELKLIALSTQDFGTWKELILYSGKIGSKEEVRRNLKVQSNLELEAKIPLQQADYYRLEGKTKSGYFAMTSALFSN